MPYIAHLEFNSNGVYAVVPTRYLELFWLVVPIGGVTGIMSFKSGLIGRIYLLHWVASPRRVDVFRLVEDLGSMRRKVGRPLIALGVVSRNACEPDLPARAEMIRNHRIWYESCESVNVVLQAQGFAATVVRTIMAQITLVARSGVIKVHPSVDIAIQRIARTLDRDPEELKRQIELTGVLSPA